jgi:tetratricopeptide (TPR) repeat protein
MWLCEVFLLTPDFFLLTSVFSGVSHLLEGRAQADPQDSNFSELRPSRGWTDVLLLCSLVALAALPYLNTLPNRFVYDDTTQIVNNPYVQSFHHLKAIFTTPVWSFQGGDYSHNYFRPLMSLGYLLCYQLFGPAPWAFHLVNIVLNVAVVILLFLVTRRILNDRLIAFVAAGLFAVHPIHSESVAWIAAVTDIELAFFYLLAFWFFLELPRLSGWRLILGELSMVASFALALLAKEPAVTLVALATLYEHFCRDDRQQTTLRTKLARYGPLWFLLFAYLIARGHFVGALASRSQFPTAGPDALVLTAFALAGQYIWKLFWPATLCAFYPFQMSTSPSDPRVIAGAVALVVLAMAIVFSWNRARWVSFALIFFLLNLAPVLNADWMAANVFTERYLYLPSVGFCWALAWAGTNAWRSVPKHQAMWRGIIIVSLLAIAAICTARIIRRNRDWHDDETFYKATLALQPGAYIFHINLAAIYLDRDDFQKAEQELHEADKLAPDYPLILNNVGLLNFKLKRYDDALGYLIRSVVKNPNAPQPHLYLAQVYDQTGQPEYAEKEYLTAIQLSPLSIRAHAGLGEFYFDHGRLPEAEKQFQESFRAAKSQRAYWGLGLVYWREGRSAEAERAFQQAVALEPSSGRAHIMLGLFYTDTNRNREALRELQTGLKSEPGNPQALDALKRLRGQNSSGVQEPAP